jgi:hypothetical protein
MSESLLTPVFLFRFEAPCYRYDGGWARGGVDLSEAYRLPAFRELEGKPSYADVRAAWSAAGFWFRVQIAGKSQLAWCRKNRIEDSEGLQIWIDVRDTQGVHRAGRYAHRYVFLPFGDGPRSEDPCCSMLPINRARENPTFVEPSQFLVHSEKRPDGYVLHAHVPTATMTGFDPTQFPRVGFNYAIMDREHGWQTYGVGPEFPITEDPSLWGSLELRNERP